MLGKKRLSLINRLLECDDFVEIMDIVYLLLENPTFITDMGHNILTYTRVKVQNERWKKIVLNEEVSENFINGFSKLNVEHAQIMSKKNAILIEKTFQGEQQIKKALYSDLQPLGLMMVLPYHRSFVEEDVEIADLVGNILAYKLVSHQGLINRLELQTKTFFSSLLEGIKFSEEQKILHTKMLMKIIKKKWYLAIIESKKQKSTDTLEQEIEYLNNDENMMVFVYEKNIIAMLNTDNDIKNFEEDYPILYEYLKQKDMRICISNVFYDLDEIREHYLQALKVTKIASILHRVEYVYRYQNLTLYDILEKIPLEELYKYINPDIQKLRLYDIENNSELCQTLHLYLNCNRSLMQTANLIYVHKNTVNKRINRCKEIMNSDLKADTEMFAYTISLAILEYINAKMKVC